MQRPVMFFALLLITSASFGQGSGRVPPDNRQPIPVTKSERNLMLTEMREFLHGFHSIQYALSRKDMKALAITAKPMGPLLDRLPAGLREKFPEEFTQLAVAQNEAFQALARIGEKNGDVSAALEQTAEVLTYCSGCHDSYRFEVPDPKPVASGGKRHRAGN